LPAAIFSVLLTVSLLSTLTLGYASGLLRTREPVTMVALVVSVASVVVMIRELDTPGAAMFRIDHFAIEDVRRTMTEQRETSQ
jgi:uncharacterized membrane protein